MKKTMIALLCAVMIGFGAIAESPAPTPSPEPEIAESAHIAGRMTVTLNGEPLTLDFDPDPQYSICRDGYVQASFYAYGAGDLLYELYMTFPQTVQPGDTVSPENSLLQGDFFSGLYLYTSTESSDVCSAATQFLTGAYPEGSAYTFAFSEVSFSGTVASFAGTIDAKLVQLDENYNPSSIVDSFSGEFDFSMDLGSSPAQPEPRLPESTQTPSAPEDDPAAEAEPKADSPYLPPDTPVNPYPPTPPSKLITPSNAQKI